LAAKGGAAETGVAKKGSPNVKLAKHRNPAELKYNHTNGERGKEKEGCRYLLVTMWRTLGGGGTGAQRDAPLFAFSKRGAKRSADAQAHQQEGPF